MRSTCMSVPLVLLCSSATLLEGFSMNAGSLPAPVSGVCGLRRDHGVMAVGVAAGGHMLAANAASQRSLEFAFASRRIGRTGRFPLQRSDANRLLSTRQPTPGLHLLPHALRTHAAGRGVCAPLRLSGGSESSMNEAAASGSCNPKQEKRLYSWKEVRAAPAAPNSNAPPARASDTPPHPHAPPAGPTTHAAPSARQARRYAHSFGFASHEEFSEYGCPGAAPPALPPPWGPRPPAERRASPPSLGVQWGHG